MSDRVGVVSAHLSPNGFDEIGWIDRLRQELLRARVLDHVRTDVVGARADDGNVRGGWVASQSLRRDQAADARKHYIEHNYIGQLGSGQRDSGLSILSREDVEAVVIEEIVLEVALRFVVFDQ